MRAGRPACPVRAVCFCTKMQGGKQVTVLHTAVHWLGEPALKAVGGLLLEVILDKEVPGMAVGKQGAISRCGVCGSLEISGPSEGR